MTLIKIRSHNGEEEGWIHTSMIRTVSPGGQRYLGWQDRRGEWRDSVLDGPAEAAKLVAFLDG